MGERAVVVKALRSACLDQKVGGAVDALKPSPTEGGRLACRLSRSKRDRRVWPW